MIVTNETFGDDIITVHSVHSNILFIQFLSDNKILQTIYEI